MKLQRPSVIIIVSQLALLLACLVFIGVLLWHNYVLKLEAKQYAVESGFSQATHNFVQGHIYLYETKLYKFGADDSGTVLTDGMLEPTGKTDGQFQVYYLFVNEDFPKVHREIQQAFVDAYNQQMRRHFEHLNGLTKTIFVFRCTNCIRILI